MTITICECDCHIKGSEALHVAPCCELGRSYYINPEDHPDYKTQGKFDWVATGIAMRKNNVRGNYES